MTGNLHIIAAPDDLAYTEAITRFQVDMAMESEGLSLDVDLRMERLELLLVSLDTERIRITGI